MQTFLFNFGTAALLTHELDAMLRQEWRLLFVLRDLSDDMASWWSIYLHLPVFLAVLYLGNAANPVWRQRFRLLVCLFLPLHAGLHFSLSDHPAYDFHHLLSALLIYGAGVAGAGYLALRAIESPRR